MLLKVEGLSCGENVGLLLEIQILTERGNVSTAVIVDVLRINLSAMFTDF